MSFSVAQGLKNAGQSLANIIAGLVGQNIVARSFTATAPSGADAFAATTAGARFHFGPGLTDYAEANVAGNAVNFAGNMSVPTNNGFYWNGSSLSIGIYFDGTALHVQNAGRFTLDAAVLSMGSYNDTTGTPGSATSNSATGRSSIAIGASSCVITNNLVTAASRIFISPKARDATGLLPIVSAQVASTSFTVSTVGNCTAALPFDWWVIT